MPLYTYECEKCKKEFDESVKLAEFDTKVVPCPDCKDPAVRKLTGQRTASSTWKNWRLNS